MSNLNGTAFLDIGCTNITDDLKSCVCYDANGEQDIIGTINNYVELLNKAIGILTILKDSISSAESKNIHLFSENDDLGISGDQELIDRFVGFGIANIPEEWTGDEESYDSVEYEESEESEESNCELDSSGDSNK
jgi:hypothetical protein